MAGATVDVPLASIQRTALAPMVWPITVPKASITRTALAPSMSLSATVLIPVARIERQMLTVVVGHFSDATAVSTFDITQLPRHFNITKNDISVAG